MQPSLLKRHLESNHAEKTNKNQTYFGRLVENAKREPLDKTGQFCQKKVRVAKASYEFSLLVAQSMKAHTFAESLVLPAAKALVRNLIGDEEAVKLESVSLSNDTVKRRIKEISGDVAEQVIAGVKTQSSGLPFKSMSRQMSPSVANC